MKVQSDDNLSSVTMRVQVLPVIAWEGIPSLL
jgi:hypothetical protein